MASTRKIPVDRKQRTKAEQRRLTVLVLGLVILLTLAFAGAMVYIGYSKWHRYDNFNSTMSSYVKGYDPSRALERRNGADPQTQDVNFAAAGPVLVIDPAKRQVMVQAQSSLPTALRATSPSKVRLVVWADRYELKVGNYIGRSGGVASAYTSYADLTFVMPSSGKVLGEVDMAGGPPPEATSGSNGHGSPVSNGDIAQRIAGWIAQTPGTPQAK